MLYSKVQRCWKLADFGSSSTATSKELLTTKHGRGTGGYRAPEVLEHLKCNNRADMFALGCIIYECVIGEKLFATDGSVFAYVAKKDEFFTERWPDALPDTPLHALGKLTAALIDLDPTKRPGALTVKTLLDKIRRGEYGEIPAVAPLPTDSGTLDTPLPMRPQVQPRFQQASKRKRENTWTYPGEIPFRLTPPLRSSSSNPKRRPPEPSRYVRPSDPQDQLPALAMAGDSEGFWEPLFGDPAYPANQQSLEGVNSDGLPPFPFPYDPDIPADRLPSVKELLKTRQGDSYSKVMPDDRNPLEEKPPSSQSFASRSIRKDNNKYGLKARRKCFACRLNGRKVNSDDCIPS